MTKKNSIHLYNVAIPILFFEMWNVILAFIFIVLIETFVISIFTKLNILRLFKKVMIANLITTIIGYLIQGILRMFIFIPISSIFNFPKFLNIMGGNLSLKSYAEKPGIPYELIVNFSISMIFAFIISIFFERQYLNKEFDIDKKKIYFSVYIANIFSYTILFIWVLYRYLNLKQS